MANTTAPTKQTQADIVNTDLWNRLLLQYPEVKLFNSFTQWQEWQKTHTDWPIHLWEYKDEPLRTEESETSEPKDSDKKEKEEHAAATHAGPLPNEEKKEEKEEGPNTNATDATTSTPPSQEGKQTGLVPSVPEQTQTVTPLSKENQTNTTSQEDLQRQRQEETERQAAFEAEENRQETAERNEIQAYEVRQRDLEDKVRKDEEQSAQYTRELSSLDQDRKNEDRRRQETAQKYRDIRNTLSPQEQQRLQHEEHIRQETFERNWEIKRRTVQGYLNSITEDLNAKRGLLKQVRAEKDDQIRVYNGRRKQRRETEQQRRQTVIHQLQKREGQKQTSARPATSSSSTEPDQDKEIAEARQKRSDWEKEIAQENNEEKEVVPEDIAPPEDMSFIGPFLPPVPNDVEEDIPMDWHDEDDGPNIDDFGDDDQDERSSGSDLSNNIDRIRKLSELSEGAEGAEAVAGGEAALAGTEAAATAAETGALAGEAGAAATLGAEGAAAGSAVAGAGGAGAAAATTTAAIGAEGAAVGAAATSEIWVPILVIAGAILLFLLIVIVVVVLHPGISDDNGAAAAALLKISKTGPTSIPNPNGSQTPLDYQITVDYPNNAQDVIVTDTLPEGTTLSPDSTTQPYTTTTDANGKITSVSWSTAQLSGSTTTTPTGTAQQAIDITKYTTSPYSLPPPDSSGSDINYSPSQIAALNSLGATVAKYQTYLVTKVKNNDPNYVDPFLSVIWSGAIEGTYGNSYSWNCRDKKEGNTINNGCEGGYSSGNWQVGYGVQVQQAASHLADDFNAVYGAGSADNADKVQSVGQAVINGSTDAPQGQIINPSTFPSKTVSTLVSEATNGNSSSQQAIAILLMDKDVGAISVAREIAGDITRQDNWRTTMESWAPSYGQNMQIFSNRMQALAKVYSPAAGTASSGELGQLTKTLNITLLADSNLKDTYLINQATAELVGGSSSDTTTQTQTTPLTLLKDAPDPTGVDSAKNSVIAVLKKYPQDIDIYKEAAQKTDIPWQVLAGIHYREGGALPTTSLVSGRPIGGNEPDVVAGEGCSASAPKGVADGIPEPVAGGCGFSSLLDTAIYAGNHLKGKVNGIPQDFQSLAKALSRYNGGGNANCGKGVPYNNCPRAFEGDDDPYVMNFYDSPHKQMYVIYCADYTQCAKLTPDQNPGTATAAKWISLNF